ncbi:unnamed protein product [Orchesella dallaii]|uniref:Uncharacterized protein n=1 Tax=Orchesella dallaii TaxID=48710 RepID=A0ABP1RI28_9HEXA
MMSAQSDSNTLRPPGAPLKRFLNFLWYGFLKASWVGLVSVIDEAIHKPQKFDYEALPKRTGQTVVLTGGNRGIGLDILRKLLQLNYHVILGVRSTQSCLQAIQTVRKSGITSGTTKCLTLDLKSLQSVQEFAQEVLTENDRIDMLINNAGILGVPYELTKDGFEVQFQVNYLSHFLLTQLLLPKMKETGATKESCCRIINVSSEAHYASGIGNFEDVVRPKVYTKFRAYGDSKVCQILFTKYLDAQLNSEKANVRVYAVHPGVIPTELYGSVKIFYGAMRAASRIYRSSDEGADVVMYAVLSPEIENKGGSYIHNSRITKSSALSENPSRQKSLWDLSQCLVEPIVQRNR